MTVCGIPENYSTCPQDGYCDGVKDRICDPDCKSEEDVDYKKTTFKTPTVKQTNTRIRFTLSYVCFNCTLQEN